MFRVLIVEKLKSDVDKQRCHEKYVHLSKETNRKSKRRSKSKKTNTLHYREANTYIQLDKHTTKTDKHTAKTDKHTSNRQKTLNRQTDTKIDRHKNRQNQTKYRLMMERENKNSRYWNKHM